MRPMIIEKQSRIKDAEFSKAVQAGTWQAFLEQDANTTRKSIRFFWYNQYASSAAGRALPDEVRQQIRSLLEVVPPNHVHLAQLFPGTVQFIEAWEALPLADGTDECKKEKHRLLANLVVSGQLKKALSNGLGLHVDLRTLAEARCWLYRGQDGTIQRHTPLKQPWRHKALQWDDQSESLLSGVPDSTSNHTPNPPMNQALPCDLEELRLSLLTFWMLNDGINTTGPSGLTAFHSRPESSPARPDDDNGAFGESRSRSATPGPLQKEGAPLSFSSASKWKAVNDPFETEHEPNVEPTWVVDSEPQDIGHQQSSIRYSLATEVPLGWPISSPTTGDFKSYHPERVLSAAPELMKEDAEVEMTDNDAPPNRGGYRFPYLEPVVDDVFNDADAEMTTEYEEVGEEKSESSEESESSDGGFEMGEVDWGKGR
ncbi:MAG: hypothetical protein Q9184_003901 [Pyrenodesmia sp. 2 TL-2023]